MYKLIAEGLPNITAEEKKAKLKVARHHLRRLDKIAAACREEVKANTYQQNIDQKRIK